MGGWIERRIGFIFQRHYAVLTNEITTNTYVSRREKERNTKLDEKLYEYLKRRMVGKPLNELQRKYLNDKKRDFAPMFLNQLRPQMILYKKAIQVEELPLPKYPEIAFIGRSNCGKSTLINELSGRTNKAKVSKMPGCTQVLHFYKIGKPCVLCIVDLPGYGFAHCKEELRMQWNEFTLFYLKNRRNLKKVFVLIDCRVGLKNSDRELLFFFDRYNVPYQIILSKCDLMNTKDLAIRMQILKEELQIFKNIKGPVIPLSSLKKQNLDELRNEIAKYQLNKQIVKQNILMKVNDLIEQKRLKKLKQSKGGIKADNKSVEVLKEMGGTSTISNQTVRDILLKDETIEDALNRWKNPNKTIPVLMSNGNFNMYMHPHVQRLIKKLEQNFIKECIKEYNPMDLEVIDKIIEQEEQEEYEETDGKNEQTKIEKYNRFNWEEDMQINSFQLSPNYKADNLENKKEWEKENGYTGKKEEKEGKEGKGRKRRNKVDKNSITDKNSFTDKSISSLTEDIPLHECYFSKDYINNNNVDNIDNLNNVNNVENAETGDINYKNEIGDNNNREITKKKEKTYNDYFPVIDENTIEKELLQKSVEEFKGTMKNNQHLFYSENVQMGNLFNTENELIKEVYSHEKNLIGSERKNGYSKMKGDVILLDEEDTYTKKDYLSGLKKPLSKLYSKSLYKFEFNLADKNTHTIYEQSKMDAYKVFQKNQLANLCEEKTLDMLRNEKKEDVSKMGFSEKAMFEKEISEKEISEKEISEKEICKKQKEKTETIPNSSFRYQYIGLKSRKHRIKGTKKLKLFGKKKNKEIINVPKDLASDYFHLPESNYIDKKKSNWNYINNKYTKWLKKIKKKNISKEITTPVKKKDIMIRYVEKEKHKYIKEQNKLLRQKQKLGMITKPPKTTKIRKKSSRNYTISNEQKMFDRDAFFKYRDVQK